MDEALIEQYRKRGLTPADGIWEERPGKVWYPESQSPAVLDIHAMRQEEDDYHELKRRLTPTWVELDEEIKAYVFNEERTDMHVTESLEDDLWRMDCQ